MNEDKRKGRIINRSIPSGTNIQKLVKTIYKKISQEEFRSKNTWIPILKKESTRVPHPISEGIIVGGKSFLKFKYKGKSIKMESYRKSKKIPLLQKILREVYHINIGNPYIYKILRKSKKN